MLRKLNNSITVGLSVVGALIATYLTLHHFVKAVPVPCGTIGSCTTALNSEYGHVGPIPTALFGVLMYAAIAVLCLERHRRLQALPGPVEVAADEPDSGPDAGADAGTGEAEGSVSAAPAQVQDAGMLRRFDLDQLDTAVFAISLAGAAISIWLQKVSLYDLLSFCPWCFTSACVITAMFVLATWAKVFLGGTSTGEQKLLAGVLGFLGGLVALMGIPGIIMQVRVIDINQNAVTRKVDDEKATLLTPDMHIFGNAAAPYTLVEFADYQCEYCKNAVALAASVPRLYPNVKLAFRNYPLPTHRYAILAAMAAEAAARQGKFWEMHDFIYAHQDDMAKPDFEPSRFIDWARQIGADPARFQIDVGDWDPGESRPVPSRVQADMSTGDAINITMTPTFYFIGPHHVYRFNKLEELQSALRDPKHPMWQ